MPFARRRRAAQRLSFIAGLSAALGTVVAQADQGGVTRADYAAATAVLERNLQGLVREPIYRSSVGRQRPPRDLLLPLLQALRSE